MVEWRSSRRGLTLVEVLISVAILGLIVGLLASIQAGNLRVARASQLESDAQQVAVTAFEAFKAEVQEQSLFAALRTCSSLSDATTGEGCVRSEPDGRYTVQLRVAGYSASGQGLLTVRVLVSGDQLAQPFVFTQYLSCLDVVPSPTLSAPGVCRD